MTLIDERTVTRAQLRETAWLLTRFAAEGVTASLSSDMRTCLQFDVSDEVVLESGFMRGVGRLTSNSEGVDFGRVAVTAVPGAVPEDCIEGRIMASCTGVFAASVRDGVLVLRRDGLTLEFASMG